MTIMLVTFFLIVTISMSVARMMIVVPSYIRDMVVSMVMMTVTNHYVPSIKVGMIPTEITTNMIVKWIIISHNPSVDSTTPADAHCHKHITSLKHYIKK